MKIISLCDAVLGFHALQTYIYTETRKYVQTNWLNRIPASLMAAAVVPMTFISCLSEKVQFRFSEQT